MKYSIISTVNNEYKQFAYVFLQSAIDNLNFDNIHEICILDTGLSDYDHQKLSSLHPKITLIKSANKIISNRSWDSGWHDSVLNKTTFAYDYLKTNKISSCLIDIDSMFVKDLYDIILNNNSDIIVCDRSEDYRPSPCIASFVGFLNVDKSIKFIEEWKDTINSITGYQTKETPALNKLINTNNSQYKVSKLSYRIIGLYHESRIIDQTRIIHFKGGGTENMKIDEAIMTRFNRFPCYSNIITKYIQNV